MPTDDELIKNKIGLDTTDAKAAVRELSQGIRVLESGFRASAAGLGDWAKSATGLEMRAKSLNGQIELQGRKVAALSREYDKVAKEKGDTSRAALDLQIKINKETESLNKMQSELGQTNTALNKLQAESKQSVTAIDVLDKKQKKAAQSADTLKAKSGGLGKALGGMGKIALGAAAAIAGMVAGISAIALKSVNAAGELVDMSLQTGVSVERLQELEYIGKQVGVDLDTMSGSWSRLTKTIGSAAEGQGDAADTFKALGVSIKDQDGQLRNSKQIWEESLAALGAIENETQRDILAQKLFGKSYDDLNPLIKTGADELARLAEEARNSGAVMSEDAVMGLEAFGDELEGLKGSAKGMLGTLVASLLPGLQGLTGTAKGYMQQFAAIISGSDGDLGKAAGGIGGLIGKIITDVAASAPQMVTAGLALIQGLLNAIVTAIPALVPAVIQIVMSLAQFILQNIPLLLNAGVQILLALITGLTTAIPQLLATVVALIPEIVLQLIAALPQIIQAGLDLILALANGIIAAIPVLVPYIPQIIQAVFNAIIQSLPMIGQAAIELILALVNGIIGALPMVAQAATDIFLALDKGIKEMNAKILEVGTAIVTGVWEGIKAKAEWFRQQISSFFSGIVNGVKKLLGIESPSKVFAGIGRNMAAGLGVGWTKQFKAFANQIDQDMGGLRGPTLALQTAGAGGYNRGGGSIQVSVQANVASEIDIHKLGRRIAEEIQRRR